MIFASGAIAANPFAYAEVAPSLPWSITNRTHGFCPAGSGVARRLTIVAAVDIVPVDAPDTASNVIPQARDDEVGPGVGVGGGVPEITHALATATSSFPAVQLPPDSEDSVKFR
jgi:hypothetical protein